MQGECAHSWTNTCSLVLSEIILVFLLEICEMNSLFGNAKHAVLWWNIHVRLGVLVWMDQHSLTGAVSIYCVIFPSALFTAHFLFTIILNNCPSSHCNGGYCVILQVCFCGSKFNVKWNHTIYVCNLSFLHNVFVNFCTCWTHCTLRLHFLFFYLDVDAKPFQCSGG